MCIVSLVLVAVVVGVSAQNNELVPVFIPPMVEPLKEMAPPMAPPPPAAGLTPLQLLFPSLNKTKLTVCTTPWTPAVVCSQNTSNTQWTGFEVEVFRLTTTRMGITDDMLGELIILSLVLLFSF